MTSVERQAFKELIEERVNALIPTSSKRNKRARKDLLKSGKITFRNVYTIGSEINVVDGHEESLVQDETKYIRVRGGNALAEKIIRSVPVYSDDNPAINSIVNDYLNDTIGKALNGGTSYSKKAEESIKRLEKRLIDRAKKIDKEYQKRKEEDAYIGTIIKQVEALAIAWGAFLKEFCNAYLELAPAPSEKYPYSTGNYLRSSIVYFTGDDASREIAVSRMNASQNNGYMREAINGLSYVLQQLFSDEGSAELRTRRILRGLTIENLAENEGYYYGWYNVEMYGWKYKAPRVVEGRKNKARKHKPYRPFHLALKRARKEYIVGKFKCSFSYKDIGEE